MTQTLNKEQKLELMVQKQICPRCGHEMAIEYPFADEKIKSYHCGMCRIQGSLEDFKRYNIY